MTSLQMVLASGLMKSIPTIALIACAVIVAIAFLMGLGKGAYRVGKGGLYWLIAGVGFVFAYKLLADKNPLKGSAFGNASAALWAFVLILGCVLAALIIRGLLAVIFKPRATWLRASDEDDDFDYGMDDIDDTPIRKSRGTAMKMPGKPGILSRLLGGLICAVNTALILAIIVVAALLFIYGTKFRYTSIGELLKVRVVELVVKYATSYAFDIITVGIVFGIAYKGFRTGALQVTRMVILKLGVLVVIVGGFAIPFVKQTADLYVFRKLIERCTVLFAKMKPLPEEIFSKLTAGALIVIAGIIVVALINMLLKKVTENIEETPIIRVVDGSIATIVYMLIGVVICAIFWAGLYLLDYCGVFQISDVFSEKAVFAKDCFAAAEKFLKAFADKFLMKYVK